MKNRTTLTILFMLICALLFVLPEFSSLTASPNPPYSNLAYAQEITPTAPPGLSGLLLPVAGGNTSSATLRPNVLRSRQVNINFNVLPASSAQASGASLNFLELNLFDDAVVLGQQIRLDTQQFLAGGYVWIGKVVGDDYSQIILSLSGGLVEGFVSTLDSQYQITFDASRGQIVNQLVPGSLEPQSEDALVPQNRQEANSVGAQGQSGFVTAQNFYQIDLMVVYTTAAKNAQGGAPALQNAIQAAVAAANQSYVNSDINLRLRLVHTEEVSYTESGSMNTDLSQVTFTGGANSAMDNVPVTRDTKSADLVTLITNEDSSTTGVCGLGWLFTPPLNTAFAPYGYNVVALNCLAGGHTLAHELGHNMGAAHDVQNAGGPGAFPYSYGYRDPQGRFRDIMAYSNNCSFPCPAVNYFSNTTRTINDHPLGNANANTALTLNNTASIVSAFRGSTVSVAPTATPNSGVVSAPPTPVPTATPSTCDFTIPDGNPASLVSAINSANNNGAGLDIICLAPGGSYVFTTGPYGSLGATYGSNALPLITSDMTILGNGATLSRSGTNLFRFFYVNFGAELSIDNLKLVNGKTANESAFTGGGAIFNEGTTTIAKGHFSDNISNDGGAVFTWGTLNIVDSVLIGNSAYYGGAVMAGNGISIVNIQRTLFQENSAEYGSSIYAESYSGPPSNAQVTVGTSCFISNNSLSVDVSDDYPAQDISASNNWWNSSNGPGLNDGSVQAGDIVTAAEVNYAPYLTVFPDYCTIPVVSPPNIAPDINYFTVNTPTLTWTPIGWAQVYEIQISVSTTFSPLAYSKNDVSSSTPFITVSPGLNNARYYWRVRGCHNVNIGCGGWSTAQSFVVKAT